jgi:thiol:disulfide interchange protein DsbD
MNKLTTRIFLLLLLIVQTLSAQIFNPVKWTYGVEQGNEKECTLVITANIEKGWHLYSQFIGNDGPIPTSFQFEKNKNFELIGGVTEGKPIEEYDKNFEMTLKFFANKAVFKQKIKLLTKKDFVAKGSLEFMVCDDHKCLPPEVIEFAINVKGTEAVIKGEATPAQGEKTEETKSAQASLVEGAATDSGEKSIPKEVNSEKLNEQKKEIITPTVEEKKSSLGIFIAGFLGGLLALLTPCVFPMIPLTVSFFTKKSENKKKGIVNALIYSVSIILIYVALGMIITLSLGPDALNAMASNAIVNMAFFIIFLIFAVSFLGAFEITLPSSWINKADSASERGGLIGIFFMAFTLSLVSFSCTGPIIGTLLVQAAVGGNVINPILGMTGFSAALALPFGLFAAFPGWLNSLPKSGGWLNSVKVVLGLLELALALKFFSNVDLAYHWGILTRELFIALWIIIFTIMGFYLLGKLKFSHDSEIPYVSIPRLLFAILTFSFVVYLVPGMWGAPLKIISGFPPPTFYTEGWSLGGGNQAESTGIPGTDPSHCPHNLSCFHDYDLALNYAKQTGKPLMVDFTGWSCVNCRKMEDQVWIDPMVLQRLRNDYVLVSLYVDDKTELPENEKKVSVTTGKKIKTMGNKWSDLQTIRFKTNSQPYYVLLDHQENPLNQPTGYDPDIQKFIRFLDEGKEKFKASK